MMDDVKGFFEKFKGDLAKMKEQILEAASVAVMMGGGPAYTHLPMVIETIEGLQG